MNINLKKRAIKILDESGRVTVGSLTRAAKVSKDEALKVLEELKNKDGLLVMGYGDELERTYILAKNLKIEQRDLLEELMG
ncbi:MAG: hypothetical protein AB1571_00270 [Nanoarchaeota archaeon]